MNIWVDADSCPKDIRRIIERAANKRKIPSYFVANRAIPIHITRYVFSIICENSDQAADRYILENVSKLDLVITRDIPLAKQLVDLGVKTINDRGTEFTPNDINTRLSIRNFMYELQSAGLSPEKTSTFNKKDVQNFAARFDTILNKALKAVSKH